MAKPWKVALTLMVLALVGSAATIAVLAWWSTRGSRVEARTVLELDLSNAVPEQVPSNPVAALFNERRMRLRDVVEALDAAADDPRVVGLVARVTPEAIGVASAEELRDAVAHFRASGKPAIAFADTFGEVTPANGAYYLATAFDPVYIQPSGDVGLTGLELTSTFLRGTLDKIGVTPQFSQRYEYKDAPNSLTEKGFTAPHRESMDQLAGSIFDHMLEEIAKARKVEPEALRAAVDRGPLPGDEALRAHLVDGLLYRDEVYDRVKALCGKGREPHLLYLRKYWEHARHPWDSGDATIALVYGVGDVMRGRSDDDPMIGNAVLGSDTVAAALRAASEASDVKAIVLRVDSPGGSYVASDTIWREVQRARKKGKPVIASFGDVAASGGYFVAMGADKIVAHPGTITGSIGVFGGKLVTKELWEKLGVSFDAVQRGAHADMWSAVKPFDEDEWATFNGWLDRVYDDFTKKAADGRHLPVERLREIAKGRVWSGVDAKRLGLVDELGGYETAFALARKAAHIAPGASIEVREYPRPRNAFAELFESDRNNSRDQGTDAMVRVLVQLRPVLRALHEAGLEPETQVLRAPEISVR
jgi:protease IV